VKKMNEEPNGFSFLLRVFLSSWLIREVLAIAQPSAYHPAVSSKLMEPK